MNDHAILKAPPLDLSAQTVSPPVDEAAAVEIAGKIDLSSPMSVAQFGQDVGAKTAGYTDTLLAQARSDDLGELGERLGEVMLAAQQFDLNGLDQKWSRLPVIGVVIRHIAVSKEKMAGKFRSVETQVDRLMNNLDGAMRRLSERATTFDAMYVGVSQEHVLLATYVRAGELKVAEIDAALEQARTATPDLAQTEAVERLVSLRNALQKRVTDLAVLQHSALQTLPMIRMMQANNVVLIEKFQTIQRLTIPAWKRTFVMTLALAEQKDAVGLADDIDDATNHFIRRNAELLNQNATATARASQRQVIDVETLRAVHDNVLKTLSDVQVVYRDGARKREHVMAELAQLRDEMAGRGRETARLPSP